LESKIKKNWSNIKDSSKTKTVNEFPIVGIGASAGGLEPITKLLENLPIQTGLSFVVIQYLASGQESMLPEILSRSTKMKVQQVTDGTQIEQDQVYVISPGTTLTLKNGRVKLLPKSMPSKPINDFLVSLAKEKKTRAIGIVLSGTGNDGTEGLKAIRAEGGITFAQDPDTAQYPDMPKNAIAAETPDFILSPEQIAKELVRIAKSPQLIHAETKELEQEKVESDFKKIIMMLKTSFGVDFTHYRETTVNRRITRRMVITKTENMKEYVEYLRTQPSEKQALFDDMLIGVTSFFREPDAFLALKEKFFPLLVQDRSPDEPVRVWVPGCSTGEEVYSLAIVLQEFLEEKVITKIRVQIFGTDANEKNIEKARQGTYPKSIEDKVSGNRLNRFFTSDNGHCRIIKSIRDMCIFAKQDITTDPPFSNIDLIMCRNVLIYFDSHLHERVLPIFHYGLKPTGFLVLGESESIGKFQYLFEPIIPNCLIYKKKQVQPQAMLSEGVYIPYATKKTDKQIGKADLLTVLGENVDRLISKEYGPATLLVNNNLDIIVFRGDVAPYLSPESGVASLNVNKIIRKEVRSQVQTALYRARKENKVFKETVRFKQKGQTKTVNIEIRPLKTPEYDEPFYLVLFTDLTLQDMNLTKELESVVSTGEIETLKDRQIRELREDLEATKQSLQTLVEGQEATNEELRSSMEEVQSSNEELQSTNEELETAKEELQSGNEELQTLNEELKNRNQTLGRLNDDLENLQTNIDVSVVIVDNGLKVRRFTASAQELLKISPSDVGRSITNVNPGFPIEDLEKMLKQVTTKLTVVSKEVAGAESCWYEMRVRPYLTSEKKIDGAVISFVDITERKLLEKERNLQTKNLETQVKEQASKIVQSERLAAIGQTAAMVGHDLRNPLQTISGETYLARSESQTLPESEQKTSILENIDTIEEQIKYMDKLIIDLQSFVKPIEVHKETFNLKQLITGILSQIDIPKNVETNIKIGDALDVVADPHLLKRVFINLSTNAVQAMPKGGVLTIKVQPSSQGQVQIIVEDTGVGIPDDIKEKIFTPLFTTRAKGQGFGLAVCKRVMEAQGGTISFDSQVGKGTAFIVGLPLKEVKR
jgi:two-component system CheB/CheR fusion protein